MILFIVSGLGMLDLRCAAHLAIANAVKYDSIHGSLIVVYTIISMLSFASVVRVVAMMNIFKSL